MIFLLICYFVFLVGFIVFSASGLYHLWRFGYVGDLTKPVMVVYIIVAVSIIIATLFAISLRSWPATIS
jgi:uncharacterized membrane protein